MEYPRVNNGYVESAPGVFRGFPRVRGKMVEISPGKFRDYSEWLKYEEWKAKNEKRSAVQRPAGEGSGVG